jgi:hypothetical protein
MAVALEVLLRRWPPSPHAAKDARYGVRKLQSCCASEDSCFSCNGRRKLSHQGGKRAYESLKKDWSASPKPPFLRESESPPEAGVLSVRRHASTMLWP